MNPMTENEDFETAHAAAARRRRLVLPLLVLAPTVLATRLMFDVLDGGGLSLARDRAGRALRGALRRGQLRLLDGARGARRQAARRRSLRPRPRAGSGSRSAPADRPGDADLPRGRGPRLRRAASGAPLAGRDGPGGGLPLLRALRLARPDGLAARGAGVVRLLPRGERLRPDLLSTPAARDQPQERRHRRLLPALGARLPLPGRARRRQPHDGRDAWSGWWR